jgi:large subunit ribosomal protein L4
MAKLAVRNWKNETVRTIVLDDELFDDPLREHLIWEAVCAHQAGARSGTHKTKNRREVSGGTKKLWRQKGTGRARMGDTRSPLWRHGGTVHGPQPRDYAWSFPKRMRWRALRSALSQKVREGKLVVIEGFDLGSHRTRELEQALRAGLGIDTTALLLPLEEERTLTLAARNNPRVKVVRALGLSIVDVLSHETVLVSEPALRRLSEVLAE